MKIQITKPYFGEEEKRLVNEVIDRSWVVLCSNVAEFERKFAEYTKSRRIRRTISNRSCRL